MQKKRDYLIEKKKKKRMIMMKEDVTRIFSLFLKKINKKNFILIIYNYTIVYL